MSELGQSRRFGGVPTTSALPQSTDIVMSARQVRFVPEAEVARTQVIPKTSYSSIASQSISRRESTSINPTATTVVRAGYFPSAKYDP
jgi:hypothetical protein